MYIMDPLAPNLKCTCNDRCSPYLTTLRDIVDQFSLAMKLVNPAWKDNIFDWDRELPKWLPRSCNWKLSGFLVYNYLKKWEGKKLLINMVVPRTLRMEFLVDILLSHVKEYENFPQEVKDILTQFYNYL